MFAPSKLLLAGFTMLVAAVSSCSPHNVHSTHRSTPAGVARPTNDSGADTAHISLTCPAASAISVPKILVATASPQLATQNPSGIQGRMLLECAYNLPMDAAYITPQIDLFIADYTSNISDAFALYAKFADCAQATPPSSTQCEPDTDRTYSEFSRSEDEVAGFTVSLPQGENASFFDAPSSVRFAGIAVTVRNGVYLCSTAALTDPAGEDPNALRQLGDNVKAAVEQLCGKGDSLRK